MNTTAFREKLKSRQAGTWIRVFAAVVIFIVFTLANFNFVSSGNLKNLLTDSVPYLVMGIGVTFVLLVGSIDLSIGAVCSTATVIVAVLLPTMGYTSYLVALAMGIVAGFINGLLVVYLKIPSFIATLGSMGAWQTVAYLVSGSSPIQIKKAQWPMIDWARSAFGIIPLPFVLALVLLLVFYLVQTKTSFGKNTFAVGVNERAAAVAGVNVNRTKLLIFTVCGACAALGGIVLAAKLRSGLPTIGATMNMAVTAAVVLGGTALTGGKGGLVQTLIGCFIYNMLLSGLNMVGITSYYQDIVFGLLMIAAVYFTVDRSDRHSVVK
ncbi:MAG: ABC transporter permease [Eubacteriales bacterium]|nr:ABC transporter permease [Eubacteriales bacterium]